MKKPPGVPFQWMVIRRPDGTCFLWNGEHCVKATPGIDVLWHHKFGEIPEAERHVLNKALQSRSPSFVIPDRGKFKVLQRGIF